MLVLVYLRFTLQITVDIKPNVTITRCSIPQELKAQQIGIALFFTAFQTALECKTAPGLCFHIAPQIFRFFATVRDKKTLALCVLINRQKTQPFSNKSVGFPPVNSPSAAI